MDIMRFLGKTPEEIRRERTGKEYGGSVLEHIGKAKTVVHVRKLLEIVAKMASETGERRMSASTRRKCEKVASARIREILEAGS